MIERRENQPEIPTVEGYVNKIRTILNKEGHINLDKGAASARAQIFGTEEGQEQSLQLFNEAVEQMRAITEQNKQRALPYKGKFEAAYSADMPFGQIEKVGEKIEEFKKQFFKDHPEFDDYAL